MMLSDRERSELVALIAAAKECLANNAITPAQAHSLRVHGENMVELERVRRFPAYAPCLVGCVV
ncbi:hypothetical protein [Acetobacter orientalis]|nr:hypothetical protein [Acetobacter orientalis]